jgi:hypothetical protein
MTASAMCVELTPDRKARPFFVYRVREPARRTVRA